MRRVMLFILGLLFIGFITIPIVLAATRSDVTTPNSPPAVVTNVLPMPPIDPLAPHATAATHSAVGTTPATPSTLPSQQVRVRPHTVPSTGNGS
jgi:hypothetical protein